MFNEQTGSKRKYEQLMKYALLKQAFLPFPYLLRISKLKCRMGTIFTKEYLPGPGST